MKHRESTKCRSYVLASFLLLSAAGSAAQAVSYRGQLLDQGQPAEGVYDVEWTLLDDVDPRFSRALSEAVYLPGITVIGGLLSFEIDEDLAGDQEAWLEIRVRRSGDTELTPLLPRQSLASLSRPSPELAIVPLPQPTAGGCAVSGDLTVDGNIGIGVSPTGSGSRLLMNGTLGQVRFHEQGDMIEMTAPSDVRLNASSAGTLRLRVAGDDRLTIVNDGRVGIGTAVPRSRLDVHGAIKIDSSVGLFFVEGSGSCTLLCRDSAAAAGFQAGTGGCMNAWLQSNGSHTGCASTVPTRCLCAALE